MPHIFIEDFSRLVDSCISFYKENKLKISSKRVLANRYELSRFVEVFHKDCGTLTPSVSDRIKNLKEGAGLILMTAHQPNFFAYSGVFRKATLNYVLAKKLEEILKVPVISFFGIADQDFAGDRWVRSCQLPAVHRRGGTLTIDFKLPEKVMLNRVSKPSPHILSKWKTEIEKWLIETTGSAEKLCKTLGVTNFRPVSCLPNLREYFSFFWNIVENSYECSEKFSDFNAYVLSKIINEIWGYDTLFSRFSECQQVFVKEFNFVLSRFDDYSNLLSEAKHVQHNQCIEGGVSDEEPYLAPFWYHCNCGSKVKLYLTEKDGFLFGSGKCFGCEKDYELEFGAKNIPDISKIAQRISARAIAMALVFFRGLTPSCYVGGVGGMSYLLEAKIVAEGLDLNFPPISVWRPHDNYKGVSQIEAMLELKQICKNFGAKDAVEAKDILSSRIYEIREHLDNLEVAKKGVMEELRHHPDDEALKEKLKAISIEQTRFLRSSNYTVINHELDILENVSTVLDMVPSIIDYAVNVGLKETSAQWVTYLKEDGNLTSDVHLETILDQTIKFCQLSV